jgi:hypothetical protein
MSSRNYEAIGSGNPLTLIACFISYEKRVQREKYPSKAHLPYNETSMKITETWKSDLASCNHGYGNGIAFVLIP